MEKGPSDTKLELKLKSKDIKIEKKATHCSVVNICSGFAQTTAEVSSKV